MSINLWIQFIHNHKRLNRKWYGLTLNQRRIVWENVDGSTDEKVISKAIRAARKIKDGDE